MVLREKKLIESKQFSLAYCGGICILLIIKGVNNLNSKILLMFRFPKQFLLFMYGLKTFIYTKK